jgi:hypothetical protein
MSKVRIAQLSCIAVSILSMIFMGAHLFLGDGLSNPSPLVEITGVLALAGLTGNAVCAFVRYAQEEKEKKRRNDQ